MPARGMPETSARGATIGSLLAVAVRDLAGASPTPLLDAQVLLAFTTNRPRSSILAFPERAVTTAAADEFDRLLARRQRREPLAYLVRSKEFFSIELAVSSAVLIPRPETELLVEEALAYCAPDAPRRVLDLGTGSGALALAIKHERPAVDMTAADVSPAALAVARANAERLGLEVRFVESDWFKTLAGQQFDLIVCNPPYVADDDVALAELTFEPQLALTAGADGLDAYRVLLAAASAHLLPGGLLLLEHGHDQRAALIELAAANGWRKVAARTDLAGHERVLVLEPLG